VGKGIAFYIKVILYACCYRWKVITLRKVQALRKVFPFQCSISRKEFLYITESLWGGVRLLIEEL
jgi:hypothetical protein